MGAKQLRICINLWIKVFEVPKLWHQFFFQNHLGVNNDIEETAINE